MIIPFQISTKKQYKFCENLCCLNTLIFSSVLARICCKIPSKESTNYIQFLLEITYYCNNNWNKSSTPKMYTDNK